MYTIKSKSQVKSNHLSNFLTNPSLSSNGYGNGFASKASRFDYEREEMTNKYSPGPSDHQMIRNSIEDKLKKSRIYNSMYKESDHKHLITLDKTSPGPGEYNVTDKYSIKYSNNNQLKVNPIEYTKEVKEKEKDKDKEKDITLTTLNRLFKTENYIKNKKDTKDIITSTEFHKKINTSIEKIKLNQKVESILNLKDKHIKSIFDKPTKIKKNLIPASNLPHFDARENREAKDKENFINQLHLDRMLAASVADQNNFINNDNINKIGNIDDFYFRYKQMNVNPSYYFLSKSPKQIPKKNHVPGPSFYNPSILPSKMSFNVFNNNFADNLEYSHQKKWV